MAEQIVELAPGESKQVTFEAVPHEAKTYQVSVNGLTGSFSAIEVAVAEFYMPSKVKAVRGEYQQWLGTKFYFSCPITNEGTAEGIHKLTFVGYHNGAQHSDRVYTIRLAPGETYTWKYEQWLMSGNYKVTLTGDWENNNYAQVTVWS